MSTMSAHHLIGHFNLKPHPEGGFYAETYRSEDLCMRSGAIFEEERHCSTAIYFLLPEGARSALHRIQSDEVWHFYLGGPMTLIQIDSAGRLEKITLGPDPLRGHKLQHVVPAGYWFGGLPDPGTDYSFVGCTVSPGFEFADFELGKREQLMNRFPGHRDWIERLT